MAATVITNRDRSPLSIEQLQRAVPSIFAEAPHESRSQRYLYVPTIQMLDAMGREGFQPVWTSQSRSRDESKRGFTKHMIRLAPRDSMAMQVGDSRPEIVMVNSHDGSSSVQLHAGFFRLVCSNGMIVSEGQSESVRMQHSAKWRDEIIEGTYRVLESAQGVAPAVEAMQHRELTRPETLLLAEHARGLRWRDEAHPAPVDADSLLRVRRGADREPTAWNTLNVLQENIVRGGLPYVVRNGNGRIIERRHTREVTGIDDLGRLNRGIWDAVATLTTGNRVDLASEMFGRLTPEERAELGRRLVTA